MINFLILKEVIDAL